jgi:CarD family transcriptional regulator
MIVYRIGEYVVKSNNGICKIEDIVHLDMTGVDKNKLYYLMSPNDNKGTKLYVPTEGKEDELRYVMTAAEAKDMIEKIPDISCTWIANEKQREQEYKKVVRSCKPECLVGIIKTIYLRKCKRSEQGKKSTAVDDYYFRLAEDILYAELAFALGKEKKEMQQLIADTIEKNE